MQATKHKKDADHQTHSTSLYNWIQQMRLTAAVAYDQAVQMGAKPEIIQKNLETITETLKKTLAHAMVHDLPGFIFAIKALEGDASKHEADARFLMDKAENARNHAAQMREALKTDMEAHKATERAHGDSFVTLVNGSLVLR